MKNISLKPNLSFTHKLNKNINNLNLNHSVKINNKFNIDNSEQNNDLNEPIFSEKEMNSIDNINNENNNENNNEREEKIGELFKKWEENTDKNKILSGLIGNKKDKNKLKEYLDKLNDITTKKKIENELRKLSKLKNVLNILENKEKELTKECLNDLKNKIKTDNKINKDDKIKRENKYKEPKKQEKIYKRKYNSQKKRNLNNDDYNKKERNIFKKRKVRRNITKSRANQKLLEKAFEKWRNNIKKIKSVEDFKQVIDGIKKINNNKKEIYPNRKDISNKVLFKKIKKASIYLLLDIYKKNRNFILKKYFNNWIKKVNLINKKINEENKNYYLNQIYDSNRKEKEKEKYKDIYKDKKKMKLIGKKGSKVFTKKKTKLNLYKERINLYNSYKQKLLSNSNLRDDGEEDYYYYTNKSNTERPHYINDSYSSIIKPNKKAFKYSVEPSYTIEEAIEELENNPYKSKSIEKRRLKNNNKLMRIDVNENSDEEEGLQMESIENKYPYESRIELEDKNYLSNIINLNKSYSSINDSTSNHFTLIEESNEIRNPIKPNVDFHNNNNISRSLKNRNRNKLKMFTISIPKGNNEEKLEFNINYNNLNHRNLITPKKTNNYNYFYSNIKTNDKTNNKKNINNSQYLVTSPSDDYFINWEEGNSMCSRIIKNEPSQDNINPNYSFITNSAKNRKIFMNNKCKSALYNIPENERLKYRNNKKKDLEFSRKKLF
jgi:hypothetical protein